MEIVNHVIERAEQGEQVFYPIYTEAEMEADPSKRDTGLFFFRGEPGGKFAVVNAGGGFMYVGAMHDSFPHALELSKMGYNAFALIYRPGAQTACEDLPTSMTTPMSSRWTPGATPCGAALPGRGWRRNWAMGTRLPGLVARTSPRRRL